MRFAPLVALVLLLPVASSLEAPDSGITVVLVGYAFAPAALVVPAGTTVTWTSAQLIHTVTTADSLPDALDGRANDPENADGLADTFRAPLRPGDAFSHRFETAGTFSFFCEPHFEHGMVATIRVV